MEADMSDNVDLVLRTFRAVEERDAEGLLALYHSDVEFHDAPSLPYGGPLRGKEEIRAQLERGGDDDTWLGAWGRRPPTELDRTMAPRVVAAGDTEVVVLYRQRAVDPAGRRFDAPVLGLYEVRDHRFPA